MKLTFSTRFTVSWFWRQKGRGLEKCDNSNTYQFDVNL